MSPAPTTQLSDVSLDRSAEVPASSYHPPLVRSGMVPRERLVQLLNGSRETPVAALIAPAGYGKTTVLAEWAEQDERPFAWITIEKADNDPVRLIGFVAAALDDLKAGRSRVFGAGRRCSRGSRRPRCIGSEGTWMAATPSSCSCSTMLTTCRAARRSRC